MSGITPLLDTLLHQVLGPKGDQTAQKNLNQPVRPVEPGEGPRALQSDSRTDARPQSQPHHVQPQLRVGTRAWHGAPPLPPSGAGPAASAQTQLSGAGRAIADILMHYPRPGSVLRPAAPLMQSIETPSNTLLAERLTDSIRQSGVFYERTLVQWFRGEASQQQLQQQPQAQIAQQLEQQNPHALRQPGIPVPEAMQSIVRHQLEMLSTPALRWEGEIWSGLFMALLLQPAFFEQGTRDSEAAEAQRQKEKTWRSELELTVHGLGQLGIQLTLRQSSLHLHFSAQEFVIHQLEGSEKDLRERLGRLGLSDVVVSTSVRDIEERGDD
ncbi:flagellar hook-length control protein FliK [Aliidiomarina sanyensis]|uniref:Flagellar hook-length control protein-like C-terminal domain-containing protein n=1 Tax=Aliidiomarina sanyensis TaxID=1249555 RepID=A0A432WQ13_9GAMM|nr:flagellar hook-length control protein FliK [Aliidiomarina sanyensis]RUO35809.1 hypothetical protein CWE11_03380 [Aliidiomarina sanyensis]